MQSHQKETEISLADKLIELGRSSGFAFSKDELMAARAELMDQFNSNTELVDRDLADVAGGMSDRKVTVIKMSIAGLGFQCAFASVVMEMQTKGKCGDRMTTTGC